ncbi:MAG: nicotinamide riboside transporter PnuC [Sarcina sp.]
MEGNQGAMNKKGFWVSFSTFQKWFLVIFFVAAFFSFISPLLMGEGFSNVFTLIGIVGLVSSLTGVITSIYQARAEIIVYPFWIINTVTYAYVALVSAYYGQVIQNILLLLPIEIIGFISWKKNMAKSKEAQIEIKKFTALNWAVAIITCAIAAVIYYFFLANLGNIAHALFGIHIPNDPDPIMDSITTMITVWAIILTSLRYVEQWWFWIFCNIGVVLFIQSIIQTPNITGPTLVGDISGALNWVQYGTGAIYGFYLWKKMYRERKQEPQ